MNRLAIFVEGYTEILFVKRLISEIASKNKILIEHVKIIGGSKVPRRMITIDAAKSETSQQYYVLLVDCGNDDQVKTRIKEEHERLTRKGYSRIIGLRDVRPKFKYEEISKLEKGLANGFDALLTPVTFILSIMEIEAWFLAEHSHYSKIDPGITLPAIQKALGFNPEHDDMEKRFSPAEDLAGCYSIAGKVYSKEASRETINALDYTLLYCSICEKYNYMKALFKSIDEFLN